MAIVAAYEARSADQNGLTVGRNEGYRRLKLRADASLVIAIDLAAAMIPIGSAEGKAFLERWKLRLNAPRTLCDVERPQEHCLPWRERYNHKRPHLAIGMPVASSRYRPSSRSSTVGGGGARAV